MPACDVVDGPSGVVLLGDARVEDDLKKEVAELLAQRLAVAGLDRLDGLVRLLDEVRRQRGVRLLAASQGHPPADRAGP